MPKPSTFPTMYDEVKTLSISFLKKHGYLNPSQQQSGTVSWSIQGRTTGSISILVSISPNATFLELDYICNGNPVRYRVDLTSIPSNLGKGHLWFFVCPITHKRCLKLYLVETYFYHREAFKGCMYSKQAMGKQARLMDRNIGMAFCMEELYTQLGKKHMKKSYAGKPTKRYMKLVEKIEKAQSIDIRELERSLLL